MLCLNARTLKDRHLRTALLVAFCGPLLVTLCLAVPQANPRKGDGDQRKVELIIHARDQRGNPVAPGSVKDVVVMEHGKKLQVLDGPKSAGPKRIAVLLDSNFHQRKVMALEQQTALELIPEFEKEKAQVLVMSYGAEIHSSGELSDGPGTKGVVVFAEGNDRGSSIGWASLARLAQRRHIACYVVMYADHSFYGREVRHYGYYLVELVPKTGGRLLEIGDNARKAREAAQQLVSALDSQGLIEVLVPDVQANRFHRIKITSAGYQISSQAGYFDDAIQ